MKLFLIQNDFEGCFKAKLKEKMILGKYQEITKCKGLKGLSLKAPMCHMNSGLGGTSVQSLL